MALMVLSDRKDPLDLLDLPVPRDPPALMALMVP